MSRKQCGAGFRRHPRIADQMTPELDVCVNNSFAAERAGDVSAALEWHRAVPMFGKGRNRHLLEQLEALGEEAPGWVWARWIAYQATRCEQGATGEVAGALRLLVAERFHGGLLQECHDRGGDPVQVLARVVGESWVFQQAVHDVVLTSFIDEFVTGRLSEHAGLAREWVAAPMRCYELGESLPGACLTVREPGGEWREVLDLGARSCGAEHGWVLGRLVPSGIDDVVMFDTPPLAVPRPAGQQIVDHDQGWIAGLADLHGEGRLTSVDLLREDYELASDVQELDLLRFATSRSDLNRIMMQLRGGRDEIGRAAFHVLRRAAADEIDASDHAYVAAAALNLHGFDEARRLLVKPGHDGIWRSWAQRCAAPARGRLLGLAAAVGVAPPAAG